MQNHSIQTKICNCQVSSNKTIFHSEIHHSFCEKCGSILIKSNNGNIYYTIKPKKKQTKIELDPIMLIKSMKRKTEENYPFIYNIYNNSDILDNSKNHEKLNIYLENRKMLILKLQKLIKIFDYCDYIFYQCLFYLDTYLSKDIDEKTSKKKILYNLIGYFLCAVKLGESDINEPPLEAFFNLASGIYLSPNKIAYYEGYCLSQINYNIFSYSAYDWLMSLISNGIIFNNEVNDSNEIIIIKGHRHSLVNSVNKYSIQLLLRLTHKNLFFKYSPMYIALSIIQLSREKFIDKSTIKPKLFHKLIHLYGVHQENYKECYEELKAEINLENEKNSKDYKNSEESKNNEKTLMDIKRFSIDKIQKYKKKNFYIPIEIIKNDSNTNFHDDIIQNQKENINNDSNIIRSRNKRTLTNSNHISIDCKLSFKNYLPQVLKNKKESNKIKIEKNICLVSSTKENLNNIKIVTCNKKEEDKVENKIHKKQKKLLTSHNLPSIYLDKNINISNNQLDQNQESINKDRPKKYKLKSNMNLGIYNFNNLVDKRVA